MLFYQTYDLRDPATRATHLCRRRDRLFQNLEFINCKCPSMSINVQLTVSQCPSLNPVFTVLPNICPLLPPPAALYLLKTQGGYARGQIPQARDFSHYPVQGRDHLSPIRRGARAVRECAGSIRDRNYLSRDRVSEWFMVYYLKQQWRQSGVSYSSR